MKACFYGVVLGSTIEGYNLTVLPIHILFCLGTILVLQPMKVQNFNAPQQENKVLTLQQFTQECHDKGVILALISKAANAQLNAT